MAEQRESAPAALPQKPVPATCIITGQEGVFQRGWNVRVTSRCRCSSWSAVRHCGASGGDPLARPSSPSTVNPQQQAWHVARMPGWSSVPAVAAASAEMADREYAGSGCRRPPCSGCYIGHHHQAAKPSRAIERKRTETQTRLRFSWRVTTATNRARIQKRRPE